MNRWQDVVEAVYGGGEPEPAPIIVEKVKREPPAIEAYSYPEKPKRKPYPYLEMLNTPLGFVLTCALALIVILMIASLTAYPCNHYWNYAIKDIPARCYAELVGDRPR